MYCVLTNFCAITFKEIQCKLLDFTWKTVRYLLFDCNCTKDRGIFDTFLFCYDSFFSFWIKCYRSLRFFFIWQKAATVDFLVYTWKTMRHFDSVFLFYWFWKSITYHCLLFAKKTWFFMSLMFVWSKKHNLFSFHIRTYMT